MGLKREQFCTPPLHHPNALTASLSPTLQQLRDVFLLLVTVRYRGRVRPNQPRLAGRGEGRSRT